MECGRHQNSGFLHNTWLRTHLNPLGKTYTLLRKKTNKNYTYGLKFSTVRLSIQVLSDCWSGVLATHINAPLVRSHMSSIAVRKLCSRDAGDVGYASEPSCNLIYTNITLYHYFWVLPLDTLLIYLCSNLCLGVSPLIMGLLRIRNTDKHVCLVPVEAGGMNFCFSSRGRSKNSATLPFMLSICSTVASLGRIIQYPVGNVITSHQQQRESNKGYKN